MVLAHAVAFALVVLVDAALGGWASVRWLRDGLLLAVLVIGRSVLPRWDLYGSADEDVLRVSGRTVVAATPEKAAEAALAWITEEWNPTWEPAVVKVEDAGSSWRVFYDTARYVETGARGDGLTRNRPLLVRKAMVRDPEVAADAR